MNYSVGLRDGFTLVCLMICIWRVNRVPDLVLCGQPCCSWIKNVWCLIKFLTFYFTGETYKIKSHITCNTVNVIYMIQCLLFKLRYIGETKRRFKDRFNEHRRPILNPSDSYIQTAVSEHFLSNSHSFSHMLLIPIEILRYHERDCLRKASEAHLIHKPKPSSLWVWTNVTNINHYVLFILFSVYFSQQPHLTRSYHVTSVYYFTVVYILHIRGFS